MLLVGSFGKTSSASSHNKSAGMPSSRVAASRAITSAFDELCDTAPCFLHIHEMGTNLRGPTRHRYDPDVDLQSTKSLAKLASTNSASQQSQGWSPT